MSMPPWCNPWLLVACGVSFGLHFLILYVPFLADVGSSALVQFPTGLQPHANTQLLPAGL